jgi:hypothetical protein
MLDLVRALAREPGAARQRALADADGIDGVVATLCDRLADPFAF